MSNRPRFISDVMLGSLAKWLRILGFDTLYFKNIDDNELIRIAKQKNRMLLTRDTGIARRKRIDNFMLISSEDTFEQLKEILSVQKKLFLDADGRLSTENGGLKLSPRCPECNGELAVADKGAVAGAVPEYVLLNCNSFFRCNECGKVYWDGSHRKLMAERIRKVLGEIEWKPSGND